MNIQKLTVTEFLFGTLGLLVGLVFATLIEEYPYQKFIL